MFLALRATTTPTLMLKPPKPHSKIDHLMAVRTVISRQLRTKPLPLRDSLKLLLSISINSSSSLLLPPSMPPTNNIRVCNRRRCHTPTIRTTSSTDSYLPAIRIQLIRTVCKPLRTTRSRARSNTLEVVPEVVRVSILCKLDQEATLLQLRTLFLAVTRTNSRSMAHSTLWEVVLGLWAVPAFARSHKGA